jgi:hypothetical protein
MGAVAEALAPAGPVTAAGLVARGVEFRRDGAGRIVALRGPKSACAAAAAEIARRAGLMSVKLPAAGPVPLLVIVEPAPTARWGACMSCGDELEPHRGGQCDLCHAALGKALRAAGMLPA